MPSYDPTETVVPILALHDDGRPLSFLGTGFFVDDPPVLVTCNHVIEKQQFLGITLISDLTKIYPVEVIASSPEVDLALLKVQDFEPSARFSVLDDDHALMMNVPVNCVEYSLSNTSGGLISLNPATRIGNVTRTIMYEPLGKGGETALELSFPVLRGASGAPVLSNGTELVWGVVAHNISRELMPAQVTTVLDERNQLVEETRYYLPQGIAIHVKHLRVLLEQI